MIDRRHCWYFELDLQEEDINSMVCKAKDADSVSVADWWNYTPHEVAFVNEQPAQ